MAQKWIREGNTLHNINKIETISDIEFKDDGERFEYLFTFKMGSYLHTVSACAKIGKISEEDSENLEKEYQNNSENAWNMKILEDQVKCVYYQLVSFCSTNHKDRELNINNLCDQLRERDANKFAGRDPNPVQVTKYSKFVKYQS